jgi:hypothetical protein
VAKGAAYAVLAGRPSKQAVKTIEVRFGLQPLSALDAQATSLKNSLRLEKEH